MFTKIKNRINGVRWLLLACMQVFENKFYAATDDRLCPPAFRYGREDGALIKEGNMTGGAMKNLVDEVKYPFNDSISGALNILRAYGRTTPQGDAVYAYMPIGSEFIVLTVDGNGAVTSADKYLKVATGANGWAKAAFGSSTLSSAGVFDATTNAMVSVWGSSSSTTATRRAISARLSLTGTGTEDGEAGRFYTLVTGVVTGSGIHGIHATAQVGDESTGATTSSCSGEMAGVRATIGTGPTMTIAAGTYASLRLDTYLQTALPGGASPYASYIYACDAGTYGALNFLALGACVLRQTTVSSWANGPYTYNASVTPSACKGLLRVQTPDGTFCIPLYSSAS